MQRILKNYLVKERAYLKAMARAKKEKTKLSLQVEQFVEDYGKGYQIRVSKPVTAIAPPPGEEL